ncbi:hypothetical protein R1sor_017731 [Riccia sorocarpa]|uniref:Reverse transcriptase zinc-binding domain-containing protein n=1 Tax=Riccia sorocarpa TaxID=122646 RepID=A0ABD3IDX6_9MARC
MRTSGLPQLALETRTGTMERLGEINTVLVQTDDSSHTPPPPPQLRQVADGICQRCLGEIESIAHMFKECPEVITTWRRWEEVRQEAEGRQRASATLLTDLIESIEEHNENPARLHTIVALTINIWADRNQLVFRNRRTRTPLHLSFQEAQKSIEADMHEGGNDDNWNRGMAGLQKLREWTESELRGRQAQSTSQQILRILEGERARERVISVATQQTVRISTPSMTSEDVERTENPDASDTTQHSSLDFALVP